MQARDLIASLATREGCAPQLLDVLFDGVYVADRQRRILFWNRGAERLTGWSSEEVVSRRCSDGILDHVDAEGRLLCHTACPLAEVLRTGEPHLAKVYPRRRAGGRFPTETQISPIFDEDGTVVAAIEVFRDVTETEALHVLEEKFRRHIRRYVSDATYEEVEARALSLWDRGAGLLDLTILYLDLVGFTPLTERTSPDAVVALLNDVFGLCGRAVRDCDGDIDKFVGDAMMAVFADANDAVAAARQILDDLAEYNTTRTAPGEAPVLVRIGVNSGEVLQGDIGSDERKDLTVIGDAVNTAARLEAIATPGGLLVSEATWSRLADPGAFTFERTVQVKGREEPVSVYRPTERVDPG